MQDELRATLSNDTYSKLNWNTVQFNVSNVTIVIVNCVYNVIEAVWAAIYIKGVDTK